MQVPMHTISRAQLLTHAQITAVYPARSQLSLLTVPLFHEEQGQKIKKTSNGDVSQERTF